MALSDPDYDLYESSDKIVDSSDTTPVEPKDAFNLIYISMVLLGAGILFPYNAMITAPDYFDHVWEGKKISEFAPFLCTLFSPILQLVMVRFSHLVSYRVRSTVGFSVYTVAVILVPVVGTFIDNKTSSYYLVLALMLLIGIMNAVLSATIFAYGAMFPPQYSQAIMAGMLFIFLSFFCFFFFFISS